MRLSTEPSRGLRIHQPMKAKFLRLLDKAFGPQLRRHYEVPSMEWSLQNMHRLGFEPRFIIDIGAFHGEWTTMVR